jgi:hypothetical protein
MSFIDSPSNEHCSKCGRDVWLVTLEYPADQKSDCQDVECPIKKKFFKPLPEFAEDDEPIFVHQLSFGEPEE